MAYYRGWRYAAFIGGFVGFIGLALYPIIISPMMDPSKYKEIQKETRKNIRQEDIQPGRIGRDNGAPFATILTQLPRFLHIHDSLRTSSMVMGPRYEGMERPIRKKETRK